MEPQSDIIAPSRDEKILRPAPVSGGQRLSRRARQFGLAGLVMTGSLIVLGIALSGRHGSHEADGEVTGNPDLIGQATPPAPPPLRLADDRSLPLPGTAGDRTGIQRYDPLSGSGSNSVTGTQALTLEQKYHEWLQDQHYKALQGQVLAAQAAYSASPGKSQEPVSASGAPLVTANSPDYFRTALDAVKMTPNGNPLASADRYPQDENRRFLEDQHKDWDKNGYLPQSLKQPAGEHELFAGSVIPAVMITGINSDLPGEITAQVRQNVFDSLHPSVLLVPQGARLVGQYSSAISYGQQRVLIAWNRLIYPNGATIALQGMPGTDGMGEAGMNDQVDNHYLRVFGSAVLISMLGVGEQLSQPQNASILTAPSFGQQAAAAGASELNNVGTQLLQKNLNIQPTLVIRPGYLFNVLVTRTMVLPLY